MKKIISFCFIFSLMLVACSPVQSNNAAKADNSVDIEELREKYPEYFEICTQKGVEVYVWQLAEDSFRCGLMAGTNRNKSEEEILRLADKSLSVEEVKAILKEIGAMKRDTMIIPIIQPYSSYTYKIDDAYITTVKKLFQ